MNTLKITHTKFRITTILFIIAILFTISSCSATDKLDQAKLENVKNKSVKERINVYFSLLSNISNDDISSSFELTYPQTHALNKLESINDKKYLPLFFKALSNDSPVIRQAAIHQMKKNKYNAAIPTLITIMNNDPVQQIQFNAMDTLAWLNAKSACKKLTLLTKKKQLTSRALVTLADINCPQAESIFLSYFKTGEINTISQKLRNTIYGALPNLKSEIFIPYLVQLTQKNNKANHNVLSAIQEIGGTEAEHFFSTELEKKYTYKYKDAIVNYILKMDNPESDAIVMEYINKTPDTKARELVYYAIDKNFKSIKRKKQFTDKFILNYQKESDEKIKNKITYILEGSLEKKHQKIIAYLINNEKNESNKCRLVKILTLTATKKYFNNLTKFDVPSSPYSCRGPIIKYIGNLKTSKSNSYLNLKYKTSSRNLLGYNYKLMYLDALGNYQSDANKNLLLSLLQSTNNDSRYTAAKGLSKQKVKDNWSEIKTIYLKEINKDAVELLLVTIAKFNHVDALNLIKKALRNYNTSKIAKNILLKKGFNKKQIKEFKSTNKL